MRTLTVATASLLLTACGQSPGAPLTDPIAQPPRQLAARPPGMGETMLSVQTHHAKLYLSAISANWPLAAYQLGELREALDRAAALAEPQWPRATAIDDRQQATAARVTEVALAIAGMDERGFRERFGQLTAACNGCHEATGRAFIVIQTPTPTAFGNQRFTQLAAPTPAPTSLHRVEPAPLAQTGGR